MSALWTRTRVAPAVTPRMTAPGTPPAHWRMSSASTFTACIRSTQRANAQRPTLASISPGLETRARTAACPGRKARSGPPGTLKLRATHEGARSLACLWRAYSVDHKQCVAVPQLTVQAFGRLPSWSCCRVRRLQDLLPWFGFERRRLGDGRACRHRRRPARLSLHPEPQWPQGSPFGRAAKGASLSVLRSFILHSVK